MVILLFELLKQGGIEVEYDGMHFIQFYQILLFIFSLQINQLVGNQVFMVPINACVTRVKFYSLQKIITNAQLHVM